MIDVGLKGGIITGGLGRPACKGMIINAPFQLACFVVEIPKKAVSGGSIPLAPGEIQGFYKPVDPSIYTQPTEGNLVDPSVFGKTVVKVRVTSKFFEGEKEYLLTDKKAKFVITAANIANVTTKQIKVMAQNIKTIANTAKTWIKNFSWKVKP